MMNSPIISLRDISIKYKRSGGMFHKSKYFEVLERANLDIFSGETIGILGGNGSGKSTLLKVIAGIIKPDSGSVINRGVSVALLGLQAGFDPNLSGKDNVIITGLLQGLIRKKIEKTLKDIQKFSELGDFFLEPVRTYSNGMKSRLGFSTSIMFNTDVILIDEALAVGDSDFRMKCEKEINKIINSNKTVIIVSHSREQLSRLCSRVFIVKDRTLNEAQHL